MANRVLLGKDGSNYVLKVSQPGDNVLSPSEPLIFDSTSVRSGMVYAGGSDNSTNGITGKNWSQTKGQLGYIPVIISMDDDAGTSEVYDHGDQETTYLERADMIEATTTHINTIRWNYANSNGMAGRSRTAKNLKFFVLRLPCQYGKMTDASLWS